MAVKRVQEDGRRCILDIEAQASRSETLRCDAVSDGYAQGVRQIKQTDLNPVYLFISPPSMDALKARLQGRGTDAEAAVQKRLATATKEIEYAQTGAHDAVIVNGDLDETYNKFKKVALGDAVQCDALPDVLSN